MPLAILIFVLAFALATVLLSSYRSRAVEAEFPPLGQFVPAGGHQVHYVEMGAGQTVVLIHGASGNLRDFTFSLAERLSNRFHVVVFDRPGFGYTPPLPGHHVTISDQADLLVEAARALDLPAPVVVGQSFGGAVAMAWAVEHPDALSGLVSISGATYPWEGDLSLFHRLLSTPVIGKIVATVMNAWVPQAYVEREVDAAFGPQNAPEGYLHYLGARLVLRPFSMIANSEQRRTLKAELAALSPRYPELDIPIEIVHGTADNTVYLSVHSEALTRDVSGARLTKLDGIGHMPHHVAEAEVIEVITRAAARAALP